MKIQDLSKDLDAKTLSAVRGGDNSDVASIPNASTTQPVQINLPVNRTHNESPWTELFGRGGIWEGLFPSAVPIVRGL